MNNYCIYGYSQIRVTKVLKKTLKIEVADLALCIIYLLNSTFIVTGNNT